MLDMSRCRWGHSKLSTFMKNTDEDIIYIVEESTHLPFRYVGYYCKKPLYIKKEYLSTTYLVILDNHFH